MRWTRTLGLMWICGSLGGCIENELGNGLEDGQASEGEPSAPGQPPGDSPGPGGGTSCSDAIVAEVTLSFPEQEDCPFGEGDNLDREDNHNAARVEELQTINLPPGAILCSISLASRSSELLFDDHLTLVLGDVVLLGGGSGYPIDRLPVVDGVHRYSWDSLAGTEFEDEDSPYFCLGEPESECEVPETETPGPLTLEISDDAMSAIDVTSSLPFRLITFGDDDEEDCAHTDVTVDVSLSYFN